MTFVGLMAHSHALQVSMSLAVVCATCAFARRLWLAERTNEKPDVQLSDDFLFCMPTNFPGAIA